MRCKYAHDMYCQVDIGLSCNMNMMKGIETLRLLSKSIIFKHVREFLMFCFMVVVVVVGVEFVRMQVVSIILKFRSMYNGLYHLKC